MSGRNARRVPAAVHAAVSSPACRRAAWRAGARSHRAGCKKTRAPTTWWICNMGHARCRRRSSGCSCNSAAAARGADARRHGLIADHVDGLVVSPPLSESSHLIEASCNAAAVRFALRPTTSNRIPYVDMDDEGAAREMTEHLIQFGHADRVIIGISQPLRQQPGLRGYRARWNVTRSLDAAYVKQGISCLSPVSRAARELLALPNPPTAVFASNDDMAAGVLLALTSCHPCRAPVGRPDSTTPISANRVPRLTTVHQTQLRPCVLRDRPAASVPQEAAIARKWRGYV